MKIYSEKGGNMKKKRKNAFQEHPVYIRAGLIFAASSVCCAAVFVWDNSRELETDGAGRKIILREGYGDDESTRRLQVRIGDLKETVDVTVSGQTYTEAEAEQVFSRAAKQLEKMILGENESLDEVRVDLDLVTEIPEYGISVSWESEDYSVIDMQGKLYQEELTEDGTLVKLTAVLRCGEEQAAHEFYVRVYPPRLEGREKKRQELDEKLKKADEQDRKENCLVLPDRIGEEKAEWSYAAETRAFGILILGAGASVMLCVSESQRKKEEEKKTVIQMKTDYPLIINKFALYIGAVMTIRRAWFCIAQDYEKNRERTGKRKAYEEMAAAMYQIRAGGSEGECYESCGARCGISSYRKFGMLLSQNLRKGPRGITELLRRESEEAFEERMNQAKKLGEEAGTKLMIPMFLMLAVVFLIVMVPALLSIQI